MKSEQKQFIQWLSWLSQEKALPLDNPLLVELLKDVFAKIAQSHQMGCALLALSGLQIEATDSDSSAVTQISAGIPFLSDVKRWSELLHHTKQLHIWSKVLTVWLKNTDEDQTTRHATALMLMEIASKRVNSLIRLANRLETAGFPFPFLETALDLHPWCQSKRQCVFVEEVLFRLTKCSFWGNDATPIVPILAFLKEISQQLQCNRDKNQNTNPYLLAKAVTEFLTDDGILLYLQHSKIKTIPELVSSQKLPSLHCNLAQLFLFSFHHTASFKQVWEYLPFFVLKHFNTWSFFEQRSSPLEKEVIGHLLKGKNIRTLLTFLTKKEAHLFGLETNAPNIPNALWCAKVSAAGGSETLAEILYNLRRDRFVNMSFWQEVILFLTKNESIALENGGAFQNILGYLAHICDENIVFSLKGRTWASVARLAEVWQLEIQHTRPNALFLAWRGANYKPFEHITEEGHTYRILQLTNSAALTLEGSRLSHCVGGYAYQCQQNRCSIWSLRRYEARSETSVITIQVNAAHQIVQARSRFNAVPAPKEMDLVLKWAENEGIRFAHY